MLAARSESVSARKQVILRQGERDRVHRDHDLGILDKPLSWVTPSRVPANSTVLNHASPPTNFVSWKFAPDEPCLR
jgi:hypothetical protein